MQNEFEEKDQILRFLQEEGSINYSDAKDKRAGVATQGYGTYDIYNNVSVGDIGIVEKYLEDLEGDGFIKNDTKTKDSKYWRITTQGIHFIKFEGGYQRKWKNLLSEKEKNLDLQKKREEKDKTRFSWTIILGILAVLSPVIAVLISDNRSNNLENRIETINQRIERLENNQTQNMVLLDSLLITSLQNKSDTIVEKSN